MSNSNLAENLSDTVETVATVEVEATPTDEVVAAAIAAVVAVKVSDTQVLAVLTAVPQSRAEIAAALGVEAGQSLTNILLALKKDGKAVVQGAKRGAKWTVA